MIQAKKQLSNDFTVLDIGYINKVITLLSKNINSTEYYIGYDPLIFTKKIINHLENAKNRDNNSIKFKPLDNNLVDEIWKRDKDYNTQSAIILDAKYTAESVQQKITRLLLRFNTDYLLITTPENICWLLNIRGNDLLYTPLILSYLLIDREGQISIYSNIKKLKIYCQYVTLYPFENIKDKILEIDYNNNSIQFDCSETPIWFNHHLKKYNIVDNKNPCILLKSVKNTVEISGFQYSVIQDGIALVKLFRWLKYKVKNEEKLTEISIDQQLSYFKKQCRSFKGKSFETISSYGINSAIIHYNPYNGDNLNVHNGNFYLLDCGSQYVCGTTDVTRTFYFGKPTDEGKFYYTIVLKGLINLSKLLFPKGTCGSQIDVIARQFLWNNLLDFPHSTGHGVGHYSLVHEGPQGISKFNHQEIYKNMVITIEPGHYIPGRYGIRIENMLVVKEVSNNNNFLQLETITLAPIEYNLIKEDLLTMSEKKWLLAYHKKLYSQLSPFLLGPEKNYLQNYVEIYSQLIKH